MMRDVGGDGDSRRRFISSFLAGHAQGMTADTQD